MLISGNKRDRSYIYLLLHEIITMRTFNVNLTQFTRWIKLRHKQKNSVYCGENKIYFSFRNGICPLTARSISQTTFFE